MKSHYAAGVGGGMLLQMAAVKLIPETMDGWTILVAVILMTWVIVAPWTHPPVPPAVR